MKITIIILTIALIIILDSVYRFRRDKKRYLPLNSTYLTEEQKEYAMKMLNIYLSEQIIGKSSIVFQDIASVISMIKYDKLNESSLSDLNKFLSNTYITIGFIKIK